MHLIVYYFISFILISCSSANQTPKNTIAIETTDYKISSQDNRCILEFSKVLKPITKDALEVVKSTFSNPEIKIRCGEVIVKLDSVGGDVSTATKIAELVRSSGFSTLAPSGRSCASACTSIFIAGVKRYVMSSLAVKDSEIGFHRSLVKKSNGEQYCAAPNSRETEDVLIFARRYSPEQAARKYYEYTFSTPCSEIKWISAKLLLSNKIATDIF